MPTHRFIWKNTPERVERYGQYCRVVGSLGLKGIVIQFEDGGTLETPSNSVRLLAAKPETTRTAVVGVFDCHSCGAEGTVRYFPPRGDFMCGTLRNIKAGGCFKTFDPSIIKNRAGLSSDELAQAMEEGS